MYLGIDLGSSSIKLTLLDGDKGPLASVAYPENEMQINAPKPGWAEQDPEVWWAIFLAAFNKLEHKTKATSDIKAIGISYQMHGLVLVDDNQEVLRPSIIWCDSRAVEIGHDAYNKIGAEYCLSHLLNSPGNFTASKLAWVKQNEPDIYQKIHKFMLPGDYLAMRLSGQITTTETGLSEGVFWDFKDKAINVKLLDHYGISSKLIPDTVPAIGANISIQPKVAAELGLSKDTQITYRAGDQPNNAFSLNVLKPGEVAATAGTSGVIYAVTDKNVYDQKSRINTFLHVNNERNKPRNGILIINSGTGILYSWLKKILNTGGENLDYELMNELAAQTDPGANGVHFFPFGNGAERVLENKILGAQLLNIDFNRHSTKHIVRAGLEGIVYALNIGFEMLSDMNVPAKTIRVGHANLFLSETFRQIFTNVTAAKLELYETDGSVGAARGAALGSGYFKTPDKAFENLRLIDTIEPDPKLVKEYRQLYEQWKEKLDKFDETFITNPAV
ncbi:MAG: FGGY family carbohydrate kinase [Gracilimonas sp.]